MEWPGRVGAIEDESVGARKALIVLTDGVDMGSSRKMSDVVRSAQVADTVIYTIHYSPSIPPQRKEGWLVKAIVARRYKRARADLRTLSEETD